MLFLLFVYPQLSLRDFCDAKRETLTCTTERSKHSELWSILRSVCKIPAESKSSRMADMSVEEMTIKANHITNESLESTRRMAQMTQESLDVGAKTLIMLDEQGEKIRKVDQEVELIKQDMKQARKNLNELSKFCGLCLFPFNRLKSTKRKKQVRKPKDSKQNVVSSQTTAVGNGQTVSAGSVAPTGPYIKRITNDDREDEMEENLNEVHDHVLSLKNMALGLHDKIEEHNQKIGDIADKVSAVTTEVAAADKQARKHQ